MTYPEITSRSNVHIRYALALKHGKMDSSVHSFLIEGPHLIETAHSAGATIEKVFFTGTFAFRGKGIKILRSFSRDVTMIFEITDQLLRALSATETPQGIIAVASCRPVSLQDISLPGNPLVAVIEAVQDPGNTGTIIRTADAAGADAVLILPGSCNPFTPKVIRATAGSIFHLPVVFTEHDGLLGWLSAHSISLAVASAHAGRSPFESDLGGSLAIVVGNESHGVSKQLLSSADITLRIPIFGRAESLNVSTAASICLYEAVRQRHRLSAHTP